MLLMAAISFATRSRRLKAVRRRWQEKRTSGAAAVEFAMLALPFFYFLFGIIETGVMFFVQATLTSATIDTARMIRTGQVQGAITPDDMKNNICGRMTGLVSLNTCKAKLQVDMRVFGGFGGASFPDVKKPDGSLNVEAMTIEPTAACRVVLFRTFYPWEVMTPFMAPLMSNLPSGNEVLMASAATFRTEPYPAAQGQAVRQATTLC